jgi:hypothetical protein
VTVGITKPVDLRKIPEHVLWTLVKDGRIAEARTRSMTPLGPELRFVMCRGEKREGAEDLLWSMVFKDEDGGGAALGEVAHTKKLEFIALGWVEDVEAFARHVAARVSG